MKQRRNLSKEKKRLIVQMLMGPYEHSWRDINGIVENSDADIGRRLRLPKSRISHFTTRYIEERSQLLNKNLSNPDISSIMKEFDLTYE